MEEDALRILRLFTPRGFAYSDQMKLVFLFKFLSATANGHHYLEILRYISEEKLFMYITMSMSKDGDNHLGEFTKALTLVSNFDWLSQFVMIV